jgi:RNA polymerase sigma factor (sigma-70 family)
MTSDLESPCFEEFFEELLVRLRLYGRAMSSTVPEIPTVIDWPSELERHREWMRGVARSRLGDLHAAEDVVQEASLSVIRQHDRPTDDSKVRSWLYQVVVRRCADYCRRESGEERRLQVWAERAGAEEDAGSDWVMVAERQDVLRRALERLADDDRRLLLMRYGEHCSYRELAAEFGVSERTIDYRLRRAKQQLRVRLSDYDEND